MDTNNMDFVFDAKDALVTADIDLIMDDEISDATALDGADNATARCWQDDAARLLFACVDPVSVDADFAADIAEFVATPTGLSAAASSVAPSTPMKSEPRKTSNFDWRQPCLRSESRPRAASSKSLRKLASSNSGLLAEMTRCVPPPQSPSLLKLELSPLKFDASPVKLEPSSEPCAGEIPYSDLVFWLGDAATGEVECSCAKCVFAERSRSGCHGAARGRGRSSSSIGGGSSSLRYSPYERMSSKIPVVAIPRIEGVN